MLNHYSACLKRTQNSAFLNSKLQLKWYELNLSIIKSLKRVILPAVIDNFGFPKPSSSSSSSMSLQPFLIQLY